MFAILICEENMPAIRKHQSQLHPDLEGIEESTYLNSKFTWYYVSGFINKNGRMGTWAAFPQWALDKEFEYDPIKIKTDWDQIVRL